MNCLDRMKKVICNNASVDKIVQTAIDLFNEDVRLCDQIATNGAELIQDGDQILTHCNTGGLATVGVGTALGVIRKAHEQGKKIHVYVDETRPLLQGGRLTAWELQKLNIPCTLITDNMAAHLMSLGKITKAIVGSDRIAKNGDFANKIGTYSVAVNCHYHNIPFYVAAPMTTVDPKCENGDLIPIEQRKPEEVLGAIGNFGTVIWAPQNVKVYNPSFDVTPAKLTSAWILDEKVFTKDDIQKGCFA
jgi:methylthioribose-1-phosphate isomerase